MDAKADVLIVGSGAAGLFCALNLPSHLNVLILTKDSAEHSNSFLAQGGICVQTGDDDYQSYFDDTLKAGHYENKGDAVDVMIRSSREVIRDLVSYGVEFARGDDGFVYTKEGGHSKPRILFHQDITGKEITGKLLDQARTRSNIVIHDREAMIDIIEKDNTCLGVVSRRQDGTVCCYQAAYTVFACGGIGGLFQHSTNFRHLTGDAIAIALEHGIQTEHIDYIQIHPTTLYAPNNERCILISESVRGEGAHLLNANMERFVDELQPRDVVTHAIREQMKKDHKPFVWLCMQHLGETCIKTHFPNIYEACLQEGYDVLKECIPVVPAQHYFMGGIQVDLNSRTSMNHLYAIGETSCNGVHGANRLASNSLLESLVFAKRTARNLVSSWDDSAIKALWPLRSIPIEKYADAAELAAHYKKIILEKIGGAANE